jgi:hypothetical protein
MNQHKELITDIGKLWKGIEGNTLFEGEREKNQQNYY